MNKTGFTGSGWLIVGVLLLAISVHNMNAQPLASLIVALVGGLMCARFAEVRGAFDDPYPADETDEWEEF